MEADAFKSDRNHQFLDGGHRRDPASSMHRSVGRRSSRDPGSRGRRAVCLRSCWARWSASTGSADSGTAKCRGFSDLVLLTRKACLGLLQRLRNAQFARWSCSGPATATPATRRAGIRWPMPGTTNGYSSWSGRDQRGASAFPCRRPRAPASAASVASRAYFRMGCAIFKSPSPISLREAGVEHGGRVTYGLGRQRSPLRVVRRDHAAAILKAR